MKTFEERYTAWLDGELSEEARADFEHELAKRGESVDREIAVNELTFLQESLRAHLTVPILGNEDFFNHRIMDQIGETAASASQKSRFRLPRLALFGGFSLATALVLFLAIIPKKSETHSQSAYIAQVISARCADPHISATAFQSNPTTADPLTVVWLDGLDYVPGNTQ